MVYYRAANGAAINIYSQSGVIIELNKGQSVNVRQETDYPNSGQVVIFIDPSAPSLFSLKLRIPSWYTKATIAVNGKPMSVECK